MIMFYIIYLLVIPAVFFALYVIFSSKREKNDREARTPVSSSYVKWLNYPSNNDGSLIWADSDISVDDVNWENIVRELPTENIIKA